MAVLDCVTALGLDTPATTDAAMMDPLFDALAATGVLGADTMALKLDATAADNVQSGAEDYGYGPAYQSGWDQGGALHGLPFGLEAPELAAWYLQAGGRALQVAQMVAQAPSITMQPFLVGLRTAEAGGWWKEAISLKMLEEGKYSDGTQIRLRLFGTGAAVMNKAFENVDTPAATPAVSPLDDFKAGHFNALEYGDPELDEGGLFPNYPAVVDSVIAAGASNYYLSAWWQPATTFEFWVNATKWAALTADQQAAVEVCCRASLLSQMTLSMNIGDRVKVFQDLGVTVHREWPHDVLTKLRTAAAEVIDENADSDHASYSAEYEAWLNSIKTFVKANQIRWNESNPSRPSRWKWAGWESDVTL